MSRLAASLSCLPLAVPALAGPPPIGVRYHDVSVERGLGSWTPASGIAAGIAVADFDDDGDADLFVPTSVGTPHRLYVNDGHGRFDERAAEVGLDALDDARGALWLDVDGDRDLDLVVAGDRCSDGCPDGGAMLRCFAQRADGTFDDVTQDAGLAGLVGLEDGMHLGGMAGGDLDGDGDLDLLVAYWQGASYLLRNDGGTFTDVAPDSGLDANRPCWQPVLLDVDRDGDLDVFQAVDFVANELWVNDGAMRFTNVAAAAGLDNAFNDMGVAVGDPDADGDLDLYVTNIDTGPKHNVLFRNDSTPGPGGLAFTEVARDLDVHEGGVGWGCTFLDADGDGRLDLAATNGAFGPALDDRSRFWRGGTGRTGRTALAFTDVSIAVGFDDEEWGSGLVAVDVDGDRDPDLVQACLAGGPLRLLENRRVPGTEPAAGRLRVRLRQDGANARAIGAEVHAVVAGRRLVRRIAAGTSILSQAPAEALFGLGPADRVERLEVHWPDGTRTIRRDVAAGDLVLVRGVAR